MFKFWTLKRIQTGLMAAILIIVPIYIYSVQNYADALYRSIYYYGAQRCGTTNSWCHAACHTNDGTSVGLDLSGGWHDCGDHVKFGQTNAYSAALLLLAFSYFTTAYGDYYSPANSTGTANGIPDLLDEVKYETDYLIKASQGNTIYYQVGDGAADHTHFVTPDYESTAYATAAGGDPRNCYSFTANGGKGGANVCGTAAAALALMSIVYKQYDATYANQCLTTAINYYTVGKTVEAAISDASGGSFYSASHWAGHMAWGAVELYRATGTTSYLTDAENFATNGDYSMPTNWVLCWNNCEPAADFELYEQTGSSTYLTKMQSEVTSYEGKMTTCGIGSYATVNSWGNLRYTANMALCGAFLDYMTTGGNATALSMAKNSTDFILGTHGAITSDGSMAGPGAAQGESFLVGYTNPDYTSAGCVLHPHHRAAFGYTTTGDANFTTESDTPGTIPYVHQLIGSLPGGPINGCSGFEDNIGKYEVTEGGIDYNAGIVGALAYMVLKYGTPAATPTFTFTVGNSPIFTHTYTRTPTDTPSCTNTPSPTYTKTVTQTNSPTQTDTSSPTSTLTATQSQTGTKTITPTYTATQTFTPTQTPSYTPTKTATQTNTGTQSITITPSFTNTNSPTNTATGSNTPTGTPTFTSTYSSTQTFTGTPTATLTYSPTWTRTATQTDTPIVSATPTYTATIYTPTITPTYTVSPTITETGTQTITPSCTGTPSVTLTSTPTLSATPTITLTDTVTLTATPTSTLTQTDTPIVSATPTYTATIYTLTITPTSTVTQTSTDTPTVTATSTYTFTKTSTVTITPTSTYSTTVTLTATSTVTFTPQGTFTPTNTALPELTLTPVPTNIIYPNPNKGKFNYTYTITEDSYIEITIYTAAFRLVKKFSDNEAAGQHTMEIDTSQDLANGTYYVLFNQKGQTTSYHKVNTIIILR